VSSQDFERDLCVQIQVHTQVDVSKHTSTDQVAQVVVPHVLPYALNHVRSSFRACVFYQILQFTVPKSLGSDLLSRFIPHDKDTVINQI
jgi:hypothetical protein